MNSLIPKRLASGLACLPTLVDGNRQLCNVGSGNGRLVPLLSLSAHSYSSTTTSVRRLTLQASLVQMSDLSSSDSSSPTSKAHQTIYNDGGTLASQQEFLDSLKPIPLESVEENSRKCGYCWRTYGEPNPGQDDAEAPVQFQKCKHVFGEQCMRSLFAIREPVRVDLKPLSFAPGSRGADLGSRLRSYVSCLKLLLTLSTDLLLGRSTRSGEERFTYRWKSREGFHSTATGNSAGDSGI